MLLDPINSVVDFAFYREIPQKSFPRIFGYLIYLGLLFSIFSTGVLYIKLNPVIKDAAQWLATSMPTITIADGKASSPITTPMILRYPKDKDLSILIDTARTTPVTYDELVKQDIMFCVTQNSIYILNAKQNKIEEHSFANTKSPKPLIISGDFYPQIAKYTSYFMYPILFLVFWASFFSWKLISSLFYSLVGMTINAFSGVQMDFPTLYKLTAYAQTPMVLIQVIIMPLGRSLPFYVTIPLSFLVTTTYLWQAMKQYNTPAAT